MNTEKRAGAEKIIGRFLRGNFTLAGLIPG